jgi:hypothetical protein
MSSPQRQSPSARRRRGAPCKETSAADRPIEDSDDKGGRFPALFVDHRDARDGLQVADFGRDRAASNRFGSGY